VKGGGDGVCEGVQKLGMQQCCYVSVKLAKKVEWQKPEVSEAEANTRECV
jgi:hypothetical protein